MIETRKRYFSFVVLLILYVQCMGTAIGQSNAKPWKGIPFEILSNTYQTYTVQPYAYPYANSKTSIIKVADELRGLTGIKAKRNQNNGFDELKLKFSVDVDILVGVIQNEHRERKVFPNKDTHLILKNAITITALAGVDIYAVRYPKGTHTLSDDLSKILIVGIVKAGDKRRFRDVGLTSGEQWDPFVIEGFYDNEPLFEIIGGPNSPVIDEGMPGTEDILGGFEGGMCVKIRDTYHMFPTERAGERNVEAYYDRVKTRIGHWTSQDAIHWTRQSTLYQANGVYAVTDDDNPLNERRGAIWSYMPVFNEKANRWYGYYLAYTVHKEIEPNHSFGRIWRCESVKEGMDGIGGPYRDVGIIMEPGLDTQLWEGRQGVDSFFPFQVGDDWLAFYGGAYPFKTRADYPRKSTKAWYVGLARSSSMEGPWTRLDTTVNPITSIHPYFIENPIVYKLPNGMYLTIFDGGPEAWGLHLPNMIGYSLSSDGYHWSEARYLPIETKVKRWWDIMRTPLCLIPEGNDVYTIVYAAIQNSKRFHPMGMVRVKMNMKVLNDIK